MVSWPCASVVHRASLAVKKYISLVMLMFRLTPTMVGKGKKSSRVATVQAIFISNRTGKREGIFAFKERGELKIDALSPRRQSRAAASESRRASRGGQRLRTSAATATTERGGGRRGEGDSGGGQGARRGTRGASVTAAPDEGGRHGEGDGGGGRGARRETYGASTAAAACERRGAAWRASAGVGERPAERGGR